MANRRPLHRSIGVTTYVERKPERDRKRVSPSRTYGRRWQRLRAAYLAQHPICECGCERAATVVDHKKPHQGDAALMYAWDNLEAMAKKCHDRKTAARDGGFGNRRR